MKTRLGLYRAGHYTVSWTYTENRRVLGAHRLFTTSDRDGLLKDTDKAFTHLGRSEAEREFFRQCEAVQDMLAREAGNPPQLRIILGAYRPATESEAVLVLMIQSERGVWGVSPIVRKGEAGYQELLQAFPGRIKWLYNQTPSAL